MDFLDKITKYAKLYAANMQWSDYATLVLLAFFLFGFIGLKIIRRKQTPQALDAIYSDETLQRAAEYRNSEEFQRNVIDDETEDIEE